MEKFHLSSITPLLSHCKTTPSPRGEGALARWKLQPPQKKNKIPEPIKQSNPGNQTGNSNRVFHQMLIKIPHMKLYTRSQSDPPQPNTKRGYKLQTGLS